MSRLPSLQVDMSNVVAHIFFAVGNTDRVVVTTEHGDFAGVLAYPQKDDQVVITHAVQLPPLKPGAPICVEYSGPTDHYRFYTDIQSLSPGKMVANLPYAVESNDRRLTRRVVLPADAGFYFRSNGIASLFRLLDLSVGGVSFVDPTDMGLRIGQALAGELVLPAEPPVPTRIEVRHLSLRRGRLQVGARIVTISVRDRDRLARLLLHWTGRAPSP